VFVILSHTITSSCLVYENNFFWLNVLLQTMKAYTFIKKLIDMEIKIFAFCFTAEYSD